MEIEALIEAGVTPCLGRVLHGGYEPGIGGAGDVGHRQPGLPPRQSRHRTCSTRRRDRRQLPPNLTATGGRSACTWQSRWWRRTGKPSGVALLLPEAWSGFDLRSRSDAGKRVLKGSGGCVGSRGSDPAHRRGHPGDVRGVRMIYLQTPTSRSTRRRPRSPPHAPRPLGAYVRDHPAVLRAARLRDGDVGGRG